MRLTGTGRSLMFVALVALPATVLASPRETETVEKTVPFPASGTLKLNNFSGDVRITGTNGRDVVIKATRRGDRDQLDHIKLDIQTSGSTVSIEANKRDDGWQHGRHDNNVVETTFDIQVPASAELRVNVFSSDVEIKGVTGRHEVESFSGRLTLDLAGQGAAPRVSAKTFSGGIRLHVADNARGSVSFDSFSGSFDSDIPLTLRSMGRSRRRMSADLPGGSGVDLNFHTFSGDVRISK
jgi:DUF4097 and DUF4098 domain-containing protein YvlB